MADISAARAFGAVFDVLADLVRANPAEFENGPLMLAARRIYDEQVYDNRDFDQYQMGADAALIELDLAREVNADDYTGNTYIVYRGDGVGIE